MLFRSPYIYSNQADGLAFSVQNTPIPITLRNIFRELKEDLGITRSNGNLINWAQQGVFLLNSILTVREKQSNSHKDLGWVIFTDAIISLINEYQKNIIFVLWGNYAINKYKLIDSTKHKIIMSSHPRPLSAMRTIHPFNGSKPFSKINKYLKKKNIKEINWKL